MYATIDEIRQGDNPWKSVTFCYRGSMPENPPKWMTYPFELVTRNICSVFISKQHVLILMAVGIMCHL